ncbi:MAG: hypothetical protein ACRD8U_07410, partial [Pyrinomonadaceae bacterium]
HKERDEALWRIAGKAGISRRRFLELFGRGGASAVMAALVSGDAFKSAAAQTKAVGPERNFAKPTKQFHVYPFGGSWHKMVGCQNVHNAVGAPFHREPLKTPTVNKTKWRLKVGGDGVGNPLTLTYG